jgi:hypothetical protein
LSDRDCLGQRIACSEQSGAIQEDGKAGTAGLLLQAVLPAFSQPDSDEILLH